jgi:hypothetical protein
MATLSIRNEVGIQILTPRNKRLTLPARLVTYVQKNEQLLAGRVLEARAVDI